MPNINWSQFPPPRLPDTNPNNGAKRLYLAGPMSNYPEFNRPAFNRVATALRAVGFFVLNPAETDLGQDGSWTDYLKMALTQVVASDGVATLDNWNESKGSQLEVHVARKLDIPDEPWAKWAEAGL